MIAEVISVLFLSTSFLEIFLIRGKSSEYLVIAVFDHRPVMQEKVLS